MSYGWLTESSLLPKPVVPINVDNSSILDLKVLLMKDRKEEGLLKAKQVSKKQQKRNKGIEKRMERDYETGGADEEAHKLNVHQQILKKKSEIYERSSRRGSD